MPGFTSLADKLDQHTNLLTTFINLDSGDDSKGIHEFLMKDQVWFWDQATATTTQYQALETIVNWALDNEVTLDEVKSVRDNIEIYKTTATITSGGRNDSRRVCITDNNNSDSL